MSTSERRISLEELDREYAQVLRVTADWQERKNGKPEEAARLREKADRYDRRDGGDGPTMTVTVPEGGIVSGQHRIDALARLTSGEDE